MCVRDSPGSSDGRQSAFNVGGPGLIPGSGRSPGEGNGSIRNSSLVPQCLNLGKVTETGQSFGDGSGEFATLIIAIIETFAITITLLLLLTLL